MCFDEVAELLLITVVMSQIVTNGFDIVWMDASDGLVTYATGADG